MVGLREEVVEPEHASRAWKFFCLQSFGGVDAARHVSQRRQLGDGVSVGCAGRFHRPPPEPLHQRLQVPGHTLSDLGAGLEDVLLLRRVVHEVVELRLGRLDELVLSILEGRQRAPSKVELWVMGFGIDGPLLEHSFAADQGPQALALDVRREWEADRLDNGRQDVYE